MHHPKKTQYFPLGFGISMITTSEEERLWGVLRDEWDVNECNERKWMRSWVSVLEKVRWMATQAAGRVLSLEGTRRASWAPCALCDNRDDSQHSDRTLPLLTPFHPLQSQWERLEILMTTTSTSLLSYSFVMWDKISSFFLGIWWEF